MTRVVIVGGGLAGCLAALTLARKRADVDLLLIEEGETFGGNHTWSYFDSDVPPEHAWVLEGIAASYWAKHEVRFPKRQRIIDVGYNSIQSAALDSAVRQVLRQDQYLLGRRVTSLTQRSVALQDGQQLSSDVVIDARGPAPMPGLDLGWQKFVGRTYRFAEPHGISAPVIMDATVAQTEGYRFIYQLPLSETELLVEDTYYSASPLLDEDAVGSRADFVASTIGVAKCIAAEKGVLPVVMDGDIDCFWRGENVARIGLRGGFFHPTTSYSLPDAVANAALLAAQDDFRGEALYALFRKRAAQLWHERSFFRFLNRMLFRAAEPAKAYRVLEHFYRLPPPVIARFYAGHPTMLDKLRILSGRPPVPLGRALAALPGRAA